MCGSVGFDFLLVGKNLPLSSQKLPAIDQCSTVSLTAN